MNKRSRLAVLLAAVLVCALALTGMAAAASAMELNSDISDFNAALSVDEVQAELVYNELMECTSIDQLYGTLFDTANPQRYAALSLMNAEQLSGLYSYANSIYNAEIDDAEYLEMICDAYVIAAEENEIELLAFGTGAQAINSNTSLGTTTLAGDATWTFSENATLTLNGTVTIPSGKTLTINGSGTIKRGSSHNGNMFNIQDGGKLVISGTTGRIVIDGGSRKNVDNVIECNESLELTKVTIQNNYTLGEYYYGGAIDITAKTTNDSVIKLTDCIINNCKAVDASAIYLHGDGAAKVTLSRTIVENCEAVDEKRESTYGGAIRTNGNGKYVLTMTDCVVRNCKSFTFGGGVYWNASGSGSSITIEDCHFLNNTAGDRGGAIFLEGSNSTIKASSGTKTAALESGNIPAEGIVGTLIQGNSVGGAGGGICYKCYSNSIEIQIPNTVATFAENVVIRDNTAANGAGVAFMLDNTHNYPENATFTFNIDGAVIEDNTATNNGGGIYVANGRNDYEVNVYLKSGTVQNNIAKNGAAITITTQNNVTVGGNFTMSGGKLYSNEASNNGGAVYVANGNYAMSGGVVNENTAINGGSAYVTGGSYTLSGGTIQNNTATANGGAVYLTGGDFTMSGGTIGGENAANTAGANGGGVYVTGGNFTMSDGAITYNTVNDQSGLGGGVYLKGGNFTMLHGAVDYNEAYQGGAVYVAGDANTIFKMESGTMNNNIASDDGGAIYATNGKLYIGLLGCTGSERITNADGSVTITNPNHEGHQEIHKCEKECTHPEISGNEAADCGGGIAIAESGDVYFYCGNADDNEAKYEGVGKNVFMKGGNFHLYDGANIGVPRDPDLVIVGGKLYDECENREHITLQYYSSNEGTPTTPMTGLGEVNEYMNLPDGEYFWGKKVGYRFFGWTAKGYDAPDADKKVRKKNQYNPSGTPVEIIDAAVNSLGADQKTFDGTVDDTMHLYALWAPETSSITYVDGVRDGVYTAEENGITTVKDAYYISENAYDLTIPARTKPGYVLKGWYLYQNEGQNANWTDVIDYEPKYKTDAAGKTYADLDYTAMTAQYVAVNEDGSATLHVPALTFGDITLIADWQELDATITYVVVEPDNKIGEEAVGGNLVKLNNGTDVGSHTVSETVKQATGTAVGAAAVANTPVYKFVGWYLDEACTTRLSEDASYVPAKVNGLNVSDTYYAKFDWDVGSLTITKTGLKAGESAEFTVVVEESTDNKNYTVVLTGINDNGDAVSATLTGLLANSPYTVTETAWSWTYTTTSENARGSIQAGETVTASFNNTKDEQWLYDEQSVVNFKPETTGN